MGGGPDITRDAPLVLLSGGGGGARLAAGLSQALDGRPLLVVTNTGDDFEHCGLTICPDTDSVLYAVSETIDPQRGWGRAEESWSVFEELKNVGGPDWFQLGIRTSPCTLARAAMLAAGQDLAGVATALGERLGVPPHVAVVPATESPVRTHVVSEQGKMAFQEYFVAHRCTPVIRNVVYEGIDSASPADRLRDALEVVGAAGTDVVLGPSNPFLSLAPILGIPGMQGLVAARCTPCRRGVADYRRASAKGPGRQDHVGARSGGILCRVDPLDERALSRTGRCVGLGRDRSGGGGRFARREHGCPDDVDSDVRSWVCRGVWRLVTGVCSNDY